MESLTNNKNSILEYLEGLSSDKLVDIHNVYCDINHYNDDQIFRNDDEFFETYFSKVTDVLRAVSYGDYEYRHEYVQFNGYGNLESFNDPGEHIDLSELADSILENPEEYDIELEDEEDEAI